jgi:hypothetical protein
MDKYLGLHGEIWAVALQERPSARGQFQPFGIASQIANNHLARAVMWCRP